MGEKLVDVKPPVVKMFWLLLSCYNNPPMPHAVQLCCMVVEAIKPAFQDYQSLLRKLLYEGGG